MSWSYEVSEHERIMAKIVSHYAPRNGRSAYVIPEPYPWLICVTVYKIDTRTARHNGTWTSLNTETRAL